MVKFADSHNRKLCMQNHAAITTQLMRCLQFHTVKSYRAGFISLRSLAAAHPDPRMTSLHLPVVRGRSLAVPVLLIFARAVLKQEALEVEHPEAADQRPVTPFRTPAERFFSMPHIQRRFRGSRLVI